MKEWAKYTRTRVLRGCMYFSPSSVCLPGRFMDGLSMEFNPHMKRLAPDSTILVHFSIHFPPSFFVFFLFFFILPITKRITCLTVKFRPAQNRIQLSNGRVFIRGSQPTLNEYVCSSILRNLIKF